MEDFVKIREELAKREEAMYLEVGGPVIGAWYQGESEYRKMDEEKLARELKENFYGLYEKGFLTQSMVDDNKEFFARHELPLDIEESLRIYKENEARRIWRIRVGLQLGNARNDQNKSLTDIAPLLGMTAMELHEMEYGKREVSLDTIITYAYLLGVKVTIDPTKFD